MLAANRRWWTVTTLFKYPHFVVLLAAFVVADIAVALLTRVANRVGAVDLPGVQDYKTQTRAIPFVGGIGIFLGFIAAVLMTLDWGGLAKHGFEAFLGQNHTKIAGATIAGGVVIAVMGLVDDFISINAVFKLLALLVITAILWKFGLRIDMFGGSWLSMAVMLLWIVGVVSAFNAIDNTDGVAGVTAVLAAFFMFLVAWGSSAQDAQAIQSKIAVALGGAVLGFLRHNKPSARVYLGNCGAFTVGFLLAVLAVSVEWTGVNNREPSELRSAVVPLLLLGYPVFDISYTVFLRWRKGVVRNPIQAIVVSGRDHTAHRLKALGLGPWGVLVVVGLINAVGGGAALAIVRYQESDAVFVGAVGVVVVMYAVFAWKIRNAVDLHSSQARISHRVPTGPIRKSTGKIGPGSGRLPSVLAGDVPRPMNGSGDGATRRVAPRAAATDESPTRKQGTGRP